MKKRSLFAAVAMLIVSALVLTSATYAWFVAGGDAEITTITGTVCEAGEGVQLKSAASGSRWLNELGADDFVSQTTGMIDHLVANDKDNNDVPNGAYVPVTSATGSTFKSYYIDTDKKFVSQTASSSYYDVYYFYVGTVADGDSVDATFTLSGGAAAAAARAAIYKDGTLVGLYSGAEETNNCYAITDNIPATTVDGNDNAIVDYNTEATDTYFTQQTITADASSGVTLHLGEVGQVGSGTNALIKVVVWLEGNDASCQAIDVAGTTITTEWSQFTIA